MKEINLNILPLNKWFDSDIRPLIISGPCSAESLEQVLATARAIAKTGIVNVFRAGLWKPRTRPDTFEGVGAVGLNWLKQVKKETGLPVAVEVATPLHVEQCLANDVDILWIGARTTVNPFSVQEIAAALKGYDTPVMIKNPVNPDIGLWLGAIERINNAGINKVIAVHRGFYVYANTAFRNDPIWEIPIELMRLCPDLPVVCDPSHIAGNTLLLESICQKALDLEMDGLMIESHINPKAALSDKEQQITPAELARLVSKIIIRNPLTDNDEFINQLEHLRNEIDKIDADLLQLLASRMDIIDQIGRYKKENNITILQIKRWSNIVRQSMEIIDSKGLNREFIMKLLLLIHEESIQRQTEIFNK